MFSSPLAVLARRSAVSVMALAFVVVGCSEEQTSTATRTTTADAQDVACADGPPTGDWTNDNFDDLVQAGAKAEGDTVDIVGTAIFSAVNPERATIRVSTESQSGGISFDPGDVDASEPGEPLLVRVCGVVAGADPELAADSIVGAHVQVAPADVVVPDPLDLAPEADATIDVDATVTNGPTTLTVDSIEFSESETRLHATTGNDADGPVAVLLAIEQDGERIGAGFHSEGTASEFALGYPKPETPLPAGSSGEGIFVLGPVDPGRAATLTVSLLPEEGVDADYASEDIPLALPVA